MNNGAIKRRREADGLRNSIASVIYPVVKLYYVNKENAHFVSTSFYVRHKKMMISVHVEPSPGCYFLVTGIYSPQEIFDRKRIKSVGDGASADLSCLPGWVQIEPIGWDNI